MIPIVQVADLEDVALAMVVVVAAVEAIAVGVVEDGNESRFLSTLGLGLLHSAGVLYVRYGDDTR